jgi:hypothetical protein
MFKNFLKNVKTTLAGSIAGGSLILSGCASKDVAQIVSGIFISLLGLLSKDTVKKDVLTEPTN